MKRWFRFFQSRRVCKIANQNPWNLMVLKYSSPIPIVLKVKGRDWMMNSLDITVKMNQTANYRSANVQLLQSIWLTCFSSSTRQGAHHLLIKHKTTHLAAAQVKVSSWMREAVRSGERSTDYCTNEDEERSCDLHCCQVVLMSSWLHLVNMEFNEIDYLIGQASIQYRQRFSLLFL